ncbi:hypothetical protein N7468_007251 [Penicillium chermesinum]|uniref:Uncharacterized protein n=1 Tax=Penicillium chermesinum TaxID=63820 RepID=A0A9W9TKD7_9EURO|nr:uncharacterized protein N7468_007251 [Penicillium chermesinum]KAJ5226026.1 hypothetical protein N7468_007251 [Penicillium chermesinum]KAJ6160778.1 hypothetical protein N7470_004174 [Penicillium chermesinum]
MMSRNLIPAVLAIGVGVFTGYYTFQPAFQEIAIERAHGNSPSNPSNSPAKDPSSSPAQPPKAASSDPVSEESKQARQ